MADGRRGYLKGFVEEGGYLGCMAMLGTFATWMIWIGMTKSLAVMLPTLQEQFKASTWLVGWMIAIVDSTIDLAGPFVPVLRDRFGVRTVFITCGLIVGASFICSAFVTRLSTMAVILAGFAGPAIGIANLLTRDLIGRCFHEYHTLAFGIAGLGGSLAFCTIAPLTQFFLDLYGWRATMMLLGALFFHLAICGALLKPGAPAARLYGDYQEVCRDRPQPNEPEQGLRPPESRHSSLTSPIKSIATNLRLDLFTSVPYWLITSIAVLVYMFFTAWIIYYVPYVTISKGFSLADAANFVLVFGIGKILGNVVVGQLVASCGAVSLGANFWMGVSLAAISTYYFVDPWLVTKQAIYVSAFVFGCFHTFVYILCDVVTKEAIGADQLGSALGWIGLKAGTMRLAVLYFPGLIFDTLGSYALAFILMGGGNTLALVALLTLVWLQRRREDTAS